MASPSSSLSSSSSRSSSASSGRLSMPSRSSHRTSLREVSSAPRLAAATSTPYHLFPTEVVMTDTINEARDANGRRFYNQYILVDRIGKGQHGRVYKARDKNNMAVAIKACKRKDLCEARLSMLRQNNPFPRANKDKAKLVDELQNAEKKIRKEIAIMKKCNHGNIVRLFEVIDDRSTDKILLVMEYMAGGPVQWADSPAGGHPVLLVDQTRRIFRDVILGLEYLHYQGIIHRDIKPANLVWTADRTHVKITDFGVSHFSRAQRHAAVANALATLPEDEDEDPILLDDSDLSKTFGTPTFLAPELVWDFREAAAPRSRSSTPSRSLQSLVRGEQDAEPEQDDGDEPERPPVTKAVDVWALGVTLYCMLFGHTPWTGNNEWNLYRVLATQDFAVDNKMGDDAIPTGGRHHDADDDTEGGVVVNLLERLLEKDYRKRITLEEIKCLPWLLRDISAPDEWLRDTAPGGVTTSAAEPPPNIKSRWYNRVQTQVLADEPHAVRHLTTYDEDDGEPTRVLQLRLYA